MQRNVHVEARVEEVVLGTIWFLKPTVGLGLDIEDTDISFKLIDKDTKLMNDGVYWRGARDKDTLSLKVFIEALINP